MVKVDGKRRGLAALVCAAAVLTWAPGAAHANRLRITSYQLTQGAAVIELDADGALEEPWMKPDGPALKVWFPKVDKLSRFEQGDSEQPVRAVRLRPGAGGTALLSLEFSPERNVTREDVELIRNGNHATVKISLRAPSAATGTKPASSGAPAAGQQPGTTAGNPGAVATGTAGTLPLPSSAAAPTVLTAEQQPASATPTTPQYKGTAAPVAPPTVHPSGTAPQQPARSPEPQLLETKHGLTTMQTLIAATIVLGGVYLALRVAQRQRQTLGTQPSIQVLGSKRLGARHQLLIVRALGQDHLLSVNGGQTERIMSADSPPASSASAGVSLDSGSPAPAANRPERDPNAGVDPIGSGMAATLRSLRSRELFKPAASKAANKQADADASPFGAELLELVRNQERQERRPERVDPATQPQLRLTESEAIAGLVRLRQRSS